MAREHLPRHILKETAVVTVKRIKKPRAQLARRSSTLALNSQPEQFVGWLFRVRTLS